MADSFGEGSFGSGGGYINGGPPSSAVYETPPFVFLFQEPDPVMMEPDFITPSAAEGF